MSFSTISVIGLGYIGLPTAAAFASRQKRVVGVDVNQHAVETINRGEIHIVEPDLASVVKTAVEQGYLSATTTPVEAGLNWAMQKVRKGGGARAGGFPGAARVLAQLDGTQPVERQRVALMARQRVPVREPAELRNLDGQTIGQVTSGLLSPMLDKPIAMGYVRPGYAPVGTELFAMVRGKPVPMEVVATPFVPTRYHRG